MMIWDSFEFYNNLSVRNFKNMRIRSFLYIQHANNSESFAVLQWLACVALSL